LDDLDASVFAHFTTREDLQPDQKQNRTTMSSEDTPRYDVFQ
jgi:hypothetical protein